MFPNDPLDVRVELRTGTAWTDITKAVYTRDAITHTRGLRNAGTSADPASVPLTINNKGGKYSPRNAESPYYGLIGRNTPIRLTVPGAPVHLAADGTTATQLTTPHTPELTTPTLDIRIDAEPYDWYATPTQHLVSQWDDANSANTSWEMYLYSGAVYLVWTATDGSVWNYGVNLPALPRRAVLRATYDTTDTGLSRVRVYWSTSMGGPWTRVGRDSLLSRTTPLRASTAPLAIARRGLTGAVYRAQVRSAEDGPILADLDLTTAQPGATSLTDATGRTWTATATAVTDRAHRFVGEVSAWPQRWTPGEHDAWTSVEAAGVLRRYGQGVKALDSPLRRRIPSGSPVAYWPMEDGREAVQAYSPIARVQPLILAGAAMASDDSLAGSLPVPVFSGIASFGQQVPRGADGDWLVSYVYRMDAAPPGKVRALDVQTTGVARRLVLEIGPTGYSFIGYSAQGAQLFNRSFGWGATVFFGVWNRLEFTARMLGTQTEYHYGWVSVEGVVATGGQSLVSGAPGPGHVTSVAMGGNFGDSGGGGISIGHLAVLPSSNTSLYDRADSAYAGESVRTRMTRLAREEGVPLSFERGFGTPQMGGQTADTLLSLLQAGAEVDGGRLTEDPARIGLRYRERATLYTQEPALVLDYQAPGLAPPLEPVDDDQDVRNDITVARAGGSSARAVLETGPLSVQDPPAGIGRYDESVTLSLWRDDQPADHAAWRLHLGAWDGARYPAVRVLLHKAPHLIPDVLQLREGDLLRLVNLPGWISREPVDLIVEGWTETLLPRRWEITFVCSPGGPWMTAVADHPVYGKAGTDASELASALTTTATTVRVRTTDGPTWTTDPAEMPVDVAIGGETMRVTAIGAPVSGVQNFTVTRSLNGVVKTHAAGAPVALAHPAIASL